MSLKDLTRARNLGLSLLLAAAAGACADEPTPTAPLAAGGPARSAADGVPNPLNLDPPVRGASHGPSAIIGNGVIQLGVNSTAQLNVPGGTLSSGRAPTYTVGLRYLPTNAASTEPGCECEGWGVGDAVTGVAGYANNSSDGGAQNLSLVSFTHDATSATSVVIAAGKFQVTHEYKPSPATLNLYEVNVTIENISAANVDVRYRRVMDWDISPTEFAEFVTLKRGTAATSGDLYRTDNNGFNSANPFSFWGFGLTNVDFVDAGPSDHGALFDFNFGVLQPGQKRTFKTYYGAAGSEAGALAALGAVGAEAYSLGQPSSPGGPDLGEPNTFIFAFGGIGGTPIEPPVDVNVAPVADAGADSFPVCVSHGGTSVTLSGTGSTDSDGTIASYEWKDSDGDVIGTSATATVTLPLGTHTFTLKVTDDDGASDTDDVVVTVTDTSAPTLSVGATPGTLWPPNHKYHLVSVATVASDACDGSVAVAGYVVSNEADEADGTGDGETTGDIKVTKPNGTVLLSSNANPRVPFAPGDRLEVRAERFGTAAPRVYSIVLTASDDALNETTGTATVTVVHDQGR